MTLPEFLLLRIAEDEAAARAASETARDGSMARWTDEYRDGGNPGQSVVWNGVGQAVVSHASDNQGGHIARWDPARVLAECQVKREIVALHEDCGLGYGYCDEGTGSYYPEVGCGDLRELATIYADHPDYQQEWKP